MLLRPSLKMVCMTSLSQFQVTKRAVKPAKNICKGDKFVNMQEFRDAVKRFAVQNGHNFRVVVSSKQRYQVVCPSVFASQAKPLAITAAVASSNSRLCLFSPFFLSLRAAHRLQQSLLLCFQLMMSTPLFRTIRRQSPLRIHVCASFLLFSCRCGLLTVCNRVR